MFEVCLLSCHMLFWFPVFFLPLWFPDVFHLLTSAPVSCLHYLGVHAVLCFLSVSCLWPVYFLDFTWTPSSSLAWLSPSVFGPLITTGLKIALCTSARAIPHLHLGPLNHFTCKLTIWENVLRTRWVYFVSCNRYVRQSDLLKGFSVLMEVMKSIDRE